MIQAQLLLRKTTCVFFWPVKPKLREHERMGLCGLVNSVMVSIFRLDFWRLSYSYSYSWWASWNQCHVSCITIVLFWPTLQHVWCMTVYPYHKRTGLPLLLCISWICIRSSHRSCVPPCNLVVQPGIIEVWNKDQRQNRFNNDPILFSDRALPNETSI